MTSPASVDVALVDLARLPLIWPHVEAWLQSAIERCGDWTIEALREIVFAGEAQLWVQADEGALCAAAVTEVIGLPRGRVCRVLALGGRRTGSWKAALAVIEATARVNGCDAMRIEGRGGWARVFDDYDLQWVTIEKRLG